MPNSIGQKLKIREKSRILPINAPTTYKKALGDLPAGAKIVNTGSGYDQVHWFVNDRAQMEKEIDKTLKLLKDGVILWIYYPKGSSKIQTDLTRDKGWENLLKHDELQWISLISFDETWSTFGCRLKTIADKKREANVKPREIFNWIDPSAKTVKLPDDLGAAFKKNKKEASLFQALSFSNKKEYLEWIITAKREETRKKRIKGTIEKLASGLKNPAGR